MPYDFFLSYACQDNVPALPGRPESEWVTTFQQVLRGKLQYYLGRPAEIFFDRGDLSGNSALTAEIEAALDGSHLFVAISSPTYYRRPWCKLERDRFIARLGPRPVEAKRVFVIHTIDVDRLIHPETWQAAFFPDLRGYYFFCEKEKRKHTLATPVLDPATPEGQAYYLEIDQLAQDMAARIRELAQPSPAKSAAAASVSGAPPPAESDTVFLAENAFRSRAEREELRTALRGAGFEVRPEASLAGKPSEELAAAMQGALAFVQIVSPMLLELPGGAGTTYDQAQLEAATAAGLPRFRWRALDLDLAAGAANFPGYTEFATAHDVRQQLLPAFKEEVIAALKDLRASKRVKQAVQGEERLVLISGEARDLALAGAVFEHLEKNALGHYVAESPAEEVQEEDVRGFLVLYGGSPAEWVRDQLKIFRTLPKTRKDALRVGIYFCPPPPEAGSRPLLYDMPKFHKIHWDDPPSLAAFAKAVAE